MSFEGAVSSRIWTRPETFEMTQAPETVAMDVEVVVGVGRSLSEVDVDVLYGGGIQREMKGQ